ncbi:MAG: restriction endonuclease [Proteobacteria bacterium]|nr:restriction endonuclease [Pseudomonadota bacterium]
MQKKLDEALEIIKKLGLPKAQHNERSALTLLALLNLSPEKKWKDCERPIIGVTPIMEWCKNSYKKHYAPNSRETFRRQTLHQFVDAGLVLYNPDNNLRAVNSPHACYQISSELYDILILFEESSWDKKIESYLKQKPTLVKKYAKEREMTMIPLVVSGEKIKLTPGAHSQLIKDIIEEFGPRFVPQAEIIYVGDTGDKASYFLKNRLSELGVTINDHGKMPDVVIYCPKRNWLILVESVTSHGPVDGKRHDELSKLFAKSKPGLVFLTAFPNRKIMSKYLPEISWETEVWNADAPTHLIHFNGDKFLGPYEKTK